MSYFSETQFFRTCPQLGWKGWIVFNLIRAQARQAWRKGRKFICPKNQTLADDAGCSVRTVQRVVHALERAGLIKVTRRFMIVAGQALQLSNALSFLDSDPMQRMCRPKQAKRDKLVTPIRSILNSVRSSPSKASQWLRNKGLHHNLC